jgi:hypothetical protein
VTSSKGLFKIAQSERLNPAQYGDTKNSIWPGETGHWRHKAAHCRRTRDCKRKIKSFTRSDTEVQSNSTGSTLCCFDQTVIAPVSILKTSRHALSSMLSLVKTSCTRRMNDLERA